MESSFKIWGIPPSVWNFRRKKKLLRTLALCWNKENWDESRGKWKAGSHQESNPGHLACAASALPLSHDNWTTTNPHNPLQSSTVLYRHCKITIWYNYWTSYQFIGVHMLAVCCILLNFIFLNFSYSSGEPQRSGLFQPGVQCTNASTLPLQRSYNDFSILGKFWDRTIWTCVLSNDHWPPLANYNSALCWRHFSFHWKISSESSFDCNVG